MPWRGPAFEGDYPSLGWDLAEWASDVLPSPADQEKPLVFTDEQARLLVRWYALDPDTGAFIYRRACLEMAKGWGKSPLAAVIGIAEFAGLVLFAGWDADGEPVGRPWGTSYGDREDPPPWVQIAALSEDQTENTYAALYELLTANEGQAASSLGIDEGRTRLYLRGRPGRLQPVTAAAGSREGQRVTFAVLDETHLWVPSNHGVRLARVLRRNTAKMLGRTMETTNAPSLGDKSVAEETGEESKSDRGILYYTRRPSKEPDPGMDDLELGHLLDEVYGEARWIERGRILKEIRDPASQWEDTLRYWFNIRTPGAGKAIDPRLWDALAQPKRVVAPGTPIGIGFDGSISRDYTVLRGCTRDGFSFLLGAWGRPEGVEDWRVPRNEVHEAIERAFATYRVGRMLADPPKWYTEVDTWSATYGKEIALAFDTNTHRVMAPAVDRWLTAIRQAAHTHDSDPLTNEHVRAAYLKKARVSDPEDDNRTRYVLVKGPGLHAHIDAAIADVLAYEAAMTMEEPAGDPFLIAFA